MNKITTFLAIIAALAALESSASAQSPVPKANEENFTLSGDSLVGIDRRSTELDFGQFFEKENSNSNDTASEQLPLSESMSQPIIPIFFQPAQSSNGNDGLQLQLDLGSE